MQHAIDRFYIRGVRHNLAFVRAVLAHERFVSGRLSTEFIAEEYPEGFSRDDVDAFAVASQERADKAWKGGYFKHSVVPVSDQNGITLLDRDEHPRPQTTMQSLAALEPAFKMQGENFGFDSVAIQRYPDVERISHVHHAGNSSGIVDGAAAVLIGNEEIGNKLGLKPRARIRQFASIGSEPSIMLTGPVAVTQKALKRAGMNIQDIDLVELNEAFSAQSLPVLKGLELYEQMDEKVNLNGGAIALGHPLGCSGARITTSLMHLMAEKQANVGLATMCIGMGQGIATIFERN